MNIQPIILAAGKGTRMGNPDLPKVLTPLMGKPLVSYLIENLENIGFLPPALVVGYHQEKVKEVLGDQYIYIEQKEQLGTGHALKCCKEALQGTAEHYLVLYGDHPLWTEDIFERMLREHGKDGEVMTLATIISDQISVFNGYGRILREGGSTGIDLVPKDGRVLAIREMKDCSETEVLVREFNTGLYCFTDKWLWPALEKISNQNAQGEYYLTDLLEIAVKTNQPVGSVNVNSWQECLGVNTLEQLKEAEEWIEKRF